MAEPTGMEPGALRDASALENVVAARRLLAGGPDTDSATRHPRLAPLARRAVLRLLAHVREHQTRIDELLVAALEEQGRQHTAELTDIDERLRRITDEFSSRHDRLDQRVEAGWRAVTNVALHGPASTGMTVDRARRLLADRHNGAASPARPAATLLDTDLGRMLYPTDDAVVTPWVVAHGSWEREESDFLRRLLRPGMTFVDIGAHVGYMSLLAAQCIGPRGVGVALEPEPGNYALLAANLLLAGASPIVPVAAAAWRATGEVQLGLSADNSGDHRVGDHRSGATVSVPAVALDDLLPGDLRVDVIKSDAQGRDHVALEGAVRTIAKSRPVVVAEYWPEGIDELGDDAETVLDFYRDLGFDVQVLGEDVDCSKNACVVEAALAQPGGYCTLILSPKDGQGEL